ncbi:DUF2690 domain-containing protein [Candidatus Saccharibacteria bacterium]|nr:DUF2690 domain-containing protein [Candidatus Saccharibacteria bacterium]
MIATITALVRACRGPLLTLVLALGMSLLGGMPASASTDGNVPQTEKASFPLAQNHQVVASSVSVNDAGCSGHDCTGLDPEKTGCASDAVTQASGPVRTVNPQPGGPAVVVGTVELRHSPGCDASWARLRLDGGAPKWAIHLRIHAYSPNSTWATEKELVIAAADVARGGNWYTVMLHTDGATVYGHADGRANRIGGTTSSG